MTHPCAHDACMIFETRCAGCDIPGGPICSTCRFALLGRPPRQQNGVITALAFTGRVRNIVVGLKYRNRRAVGRHLAGLIVNRLIEVDAHHDLDVITWAPTSAKRRRERGFDQGELLARTVARQLGLPCRHLLERDDSASQTGRTRAERLAGPSFRARPGLEGRRILVVDDVVTTGATLERAGDALRRRGGDPVLAALAATPDRNSATVLPFRQPAATSAA